MPNTELSDEDIRREFEKCNDTAKNLGLPEVVKSCSELRYYPDSQNTVRENCFRAIINPQEIKIAEDPGAAFVFHGNEYGLGQHEWHNYACWR